MSECGHDGWQAGCPICEREHGIAMHIVTPELIDKGYREAFGMTRAQAHEQGVCVKCGKPPIFYTEAGRREWRISAVCEPCFDAMFPEEDE